MKLIILSEQFGGVVSREGTKTQLFVGGGLSTAYGQDF